VYLGTNTEMQGLPLNATIHAEQFAMVIALQAGEGIISFAATAAPCGHCRQFLNELREGGDVRVLSLMVDKFDKTKFDSLLSDLLLHSFGPLDLDQAVEVPLLLEPRNNFIRLHSLELVTVYSGHRKNTDRSWKMTASAVNRPLDKALEEANAAYAPYSGSTAGLALCTSAAKIFTGRSIESAAYNPSMSPLHTALAAHVQSCAGLQCDLWSNISGVVMVEIHQAQVQYAGTVETMLYSLAPDAELIIVYGTTAGCVDGAF